MTSKIIVSVPHSGTRFLKKRLGIKDHVHANANWVKLWEEVEGREVIVPLRKPPSVLRSWCRRRADRELVNWIAQFCASWFILHALDQMMELDYICIDKCEDPRIDDWTKVGDEDGSHVRWKLHKVDLRPIYKLPFVDRHYPLK